MSFISSRAAKALNARTVKPLNISISTLRASPHKAVRTMKQKQKQYRPHCKIYQNISKIKQKLRKI